MAQREKVFAAKLGDMSSIPRTDVVVRNPISGSCPLTFTYVSGLHTHNTHNNVTLNIKTPDQEAIMLVWG